MSPEQQGMPPAGRAREKELMLGKDSSSTSPRAVAPYKSSLVPLLRAVDILFIFLCLAFFIWILQRGYLGDQYLIALLSAIILFLFFAYLFDLYSIWQHPPRVLGLDKVLQVWIGTIICLLFLGFATKTTARFSRLVMGFWFLSVPLILAGWRLVCHRFLQRKNRKARNQTSAAIAGAGDLGLHLAEFIARDPVLGMRVTAFYDDHKQVGHRPLGEVQALVEGTLDELCSAASKGEVDQVYLALPLRAEQRLKEVVQRLADAKASVYVVPDLFVFDLLQSSWMTMYGLPLVNIYGTPYTGLFSWVKGIIDYALAFGILVLISPALVFIALGIKFSSPGPVLFKQPRYGMNGEEITIWKFRTMTVCEEGTEECVQAGPRDSRMTRFGAFLRRYSLDELPQFINVLQGRLSVVGPRPHAVAHNQEYRKLIPSYMLRHKVKPGITGWAQVNGWRGETDTQEKMEKRVEYDIEYIRNWSPALDLKIVFRTIGCLFTSDQAY